MLALVCAYQLLVLSTVVQSLRTCLLHRFIASSHFEGEIAFGNAGPVLTYMA
jgi:hypothetical protein